MTAFALGYLVAHGAVLTTVLGAMMLVIIADLTGAAWFDAYRRTSLLLVRLVPWLGILFVPVLVMSPVLYPWARPAQLTPEARSFVEARDTMLSVTAFLVRAVLYWAAWTWLGTRLQRMNAGDRATSTDRGEHVRIAAGGLPLLGLTITLAAFDWFMTISLPWHSSVYGLYCAAGGFLAAVALLGLRGAREPGIGPDECHALAKVMFTAILFWVYLAYAQYVIVWIGDLPREVTWYNDRLRGPWAWIALVLVAGHAVPFVILLFRRARRSATLLAALGGWLLVMHLLDVAWLLAPEAGQRSAGAMLWAVGFFILFTFGLLVPVRSFGHGGTQRDVPWQRARHGRGAR